MRGKRAEKRRIKPDPKYNSMSIAKFINYIMRRGKKSLAQKIVYESFDMVKQKTNREPTEIFERAVKNVAPLLEVKSRRIGGATYQIPIQVKGDRRQALAFHWIIDAAKARKGMPMKEKIALELIDAANETGGAIKKKQEVQKAAEASRAFAHFARFG